MAVTNDNLELKADSIDQLQVNAEPDEGGFMSGLSGNAVRQMFPLLNAQPDLAYLDSAATTQVPRSVLDAMDSFESTSRANIHRGIYPLADEASQAYEDARGIVGNFFGAAPDEIVFTHGATESLNLAIQGWGSQNLTANDTVLIDTASHHSAIVPWQLLQARIPFQIRFIKLNKQGTLDHTHWQGLLKQRPKAVMLTHSSNVTGLINDLETLTREAHKSGAVVFADCAQSAPHRNLDFHQIDIDFAALSAHKLYGPFGIGALFIKKDLFNSVSPLMGGGGMVSTVSTEGFTTLAGPSGFEAGTPNICGAVGFAEACRFINSLDREAIAQRNRELCNQILDVLTSFKGVRILGAAEPNIRDAVVSFFLPAIHPHDLAETLGAAGVAVRAGHHCALPLHQALNVPASVRVSFSAYSTEKDVNRFATALLHAWETLR